MDTLLTIAEIAVAFAGFASIASAITKTYSGLDPKVNSLRLQNMVDIALTVVVASFMPVLTREIFESEQLMWMTASAVSLIFGAFTFIRVSKRAKPMVNLEGYDKGGSLRIRIIGAFSLIGLFVGSTGLLPEHAYAIYLGSVLLTLLVSGMLFFRVIESLVYRISEKENSATTESDVYVKSNSTDSLGENET